MKLYTKPDTRPWLARIPWRTVAVLGIGLVLTAGLVWGAARLHPWRGAPDVSKIEGKEASKLLASDDFDKLSKKQQQEVFDNLRQRINEESNFKMPRLRELSDKERENFHKNVEPMIMNVIDEKARTYVTLPPDQRAAYIEESLTTGEMAKLGSLLGQGQPSGKGPHPEVFKKQFESTKPHDLAARAAFGRGVMEYVIARRARQALEKAQNLFKPAPKPAVNPGQ